MDSNTTTTATIPPAHAESELVRSLCTSGCYRTPEVRRRIGASRLFGRWDGWVYWRVARVITAGSWAARRGRHDAAQWRRESEDLLQIMEAAGGSVTIEGMAPALAIDGPVVYIGNHMGMLETFFLPGIALAHGEVTFILKESLLEYPLFGTLLKATHPIAVTRKDPRGDLKHVLSRGVEMLKSGRSIVVFPQATRSTVFTPSQFNTLGVKLAERAGVPVVPLALKTDFMRVGKVVRDFGSLDRALPIHFRFGPPIMPPFKSRDAHATVVDFIRKCLIDWGGSVGNE
ncbi:MAG: 1-acyl-sn-glycerol-3-phosphate acyltransferase [Kiritimatiellae bacterium]|nr:1-acyl-sn-glycerol-3-phosphate acyltransferase [Kiritimatiellia bacterium]